MLFMLDNFSSMALGMLSRVMMCQQKLTSPSSVLASYLVASGLRELLPVVGAVIETRDSVFTWSS